MAATILLVEDDEAMQYVIARTLESEGFDVERAADGEAGLAAARARQFDVVLLDWMLPKLSGIELCRTLREESSVPIIMLTARDAEVDRVLGLELGADDYVAKPFSNAELVSRIRAVLRRRELDRERPRLARVGALVLDPGRHRVEVAGEPVQLTPTEFRLVALLASEPERVFTREEIMRHLWESAYVGDPRTVDVHVRNVRRKIERDPGRPARLATVRGIGYQLLDR